MDTDITLNIKQTMSIPSELYDRTAADYDRTRGAVGVEIILGCFAVGGDLHRQTIIDAGCGTGNYAHALARHVGSMHAVDRSEAMLAQAQAKAGRVTFHHASIDSLPFYDRVADGVTVNQVLHHLGDEDAVAAALHALHRVLRPGGALVINTCSHRQLRHGFWPYKLLPEAKLEAMLARHVDVPRLREMLSAAGFSHRAVIAPLDAVLQGDAYFNPRGPANANWRSGDSIWSLLSAAETKTVEKRIAKLAREKALKKFMQDADAERKNCGQISFVFSVKARKSVTMSATQSIGKSTVTGGSP